MYIDAESLKRRFVIPAEEPACGSSATTQEPATRAAIPVTPEDDYDNDPESAFRKIERLLSVRDRSIAEIRNRLQRDRFTERALSEALERAIRCGYLDDDRFADGFIRSRLRASKGINGIVRDLKNHHIDAYAIPGFPDSFLEEQGSQLDNALRLLQRKPPRAKNKQQAAYAKLIRNGFSSSVASTAVKRWAAEQI